MNDVEDIQRGFYDKWTYKFLEDYLTHNKRIELAILFAKKWIKSNSKDILDVGCGIGWSTFEISKSYPNSCVHGIDLSKNSIKAAKLLFNSNNTFFQNLSFFDIDKNSKFDSIILLDVYEHIQKAKRGDFNIFLSNLLSDNSRIILTAPSKYHQKWLEENDPNGLQPVDESIEIDDLNKLAKFTSGDIIYFNFISIANTNDYFHAVIERNVVYSPIEYTKLNNKDLESKKSRIKRVNQTPFKDWYCKNKSRLKGQKKIKKLIYDNSPYQLKKLWKIIKNAR